MVEELQLQACMLGGGGRDGQAAAWQVGPELGKVGLWQQVLKAHACVGMCVPQCVAAWCGCGGAVMCDCKRTVPPLPLPPGHTLT